MLNVEAIKIQDTVTVPRHEWEQLVRESANLSSIESLARTEKYVDGSTILSICGHVGEKPEEEKV